MRRFSDYNPLAVSVFFLCAAIPAMFCMNPVLLAISFAGSFLLWFILNEGRLSAKEILLYILLPLIGAVINPLFNHNGATVLFVLNNNPVTKEAFFYGAVMGLMLSTVLLWFRSFSFIMTSEKLLYVFGRLSPKAALILSMTLRYLPLYRKQAAKTAEARKAVGLMREDNLIERLHSRLMVFSGMVTWALENGVVTADSMDARGYGTGRRTQFSVFKWTRQDSLFLLGTLLFLFPWILAMLKKAAAVEWYPVIRMPEVSFIAITAYIFYGLLSLAPVILEVKENLKWKSLQSNI